MVDNETDQPELDMKKLVINETCAMRCAPPAALRVGVRVVLTGSFDLHQQPLKTMKLAKSYEL